MNDPQIQLVNELYATFQDYMSRQNIIDIIRNMGDVANEFYYEQCEQYAAKIENQRTELAYYNQQQQQQKVKDDKKRQQKLKNDKKMIQVLLIIIIILIAITIPSVMYFFSNRTPEYIKYTRALRGYNYVLSVDTTSDILQKFIVKILGTFQESEKHAISAAQSTDEFDLDQTGLGTTGFGADVYQMQELDADKCKDKLSDVIKAFNIDPKTEKDIFDALSSGQFQKTKYYVDVKSHHIDVYYIRLFIAKMHENKYLLSYGAIHWAFSTNEEYITEKQKYLLRGKVESEAIHEFSKTLSKPQMDDFSIAF
eukprot:540524_1